MISLESTAPARLRKSLVNCGAGLSLVFCVVWHPFAGGLRAEADTVLFCGYRLTLSHSERGATRWNQVQNDPDLLIFESISDSDQPGGDPIQAQWLLSCSPNGARTSQVTEIRDQAEARGQVIHQLEELTIDRGIAAAVFSRTRVFEGKRVKSVESYFATRDLEYRIFALPVKNSSGQVPPVAYLKLDRIMRALLERSHFAGEINPTITEATYRWRLYALIGGGGIAAILCLLLVIRIVLRRPAKGSAENKE